MINEAPHRPDCRPQVSLEYPKSAGQPEEDENDDHEANESREGSVFLGAGDALGELGLFPKRFVLYSTLILCSFLDLTAFTASISITTMCLSCIYDG